MGGAMGGQPTAVAATPPAGNPPAHRMDPFKPWWPTDPIPPPVLSVIAPARFANIGTAAIASTPEIHIRETPNMRVAGILSGNGVYALIDGPGVQQVVKPGDLVGEYRVESINPDSVTLKRKEKLADATRTYTQVIPLTDIGSNMGAIMSAPGQGGFGPGAPGRGGGGRLGGMGGIGAAE